MKNNIYAAGFLTLGLVLVAWIAACTAQNIFQLKRTVTVKGLAEQQVEATVGTWNLPFHASSATLVKARTIGEKHQAALTKHFTQFGLTSTEMKLQPMSIRHERENIGNNQWRSKYVTQGQIRIRTTNLNALELASSATDQLLAKNINLGRQYGDVPLPQFIFTNLNNVKPSLIAAATQNARNAAEQFAEDSGSTIGGIARANQGVVSILSRDGDYNERAERFKTIRVVSTIDYFLKN